MSRSLIRIAGAAGILAVVALAPSVGAQSLSIYDIQYGDDPNGLSPYDGAVVDCGRRHLRRQVSWISPATDPPGPGRSGSMGRKSRLRTGSRRTTCSTTFRSATGSHLPTCSSRIFVGRLFCNVKRRKIPATQSSAAGIPYRLLGWSRPRNFRLRSTIPTTTAGTSSTHGRGKIRVHAVAGSRCDRYADESRQGGG